MKLRKFFILHTAVEVTIGLVIIAIPTLLSSITGATLTEPEGIQFARLLGITVLSLGVLTWFTRNLKPSAALKGVLISLALWHGLDALNLAYGIIEQSKGLIAWMFPLAHAAFSLGFLAYLLTLKKT